MAALLLALHDVVTEYYAASLRPCMYVCAQDDYHPSWMYSSSPGCRDPGFPRPAGCANETSGLWVYPGAYTSRSVWRWFDDDDDMRCVTADCMQSTKRPYSRS